EAAAERGRLAAWAAIKAMRPHAEDKVPPVEDILKALARAEKGRAFLDRLFLPPRQFRVPAEDETIVCRCEEATAGAVRQAVKTGATGPNQLKAYLRCGMGPCQGRLCGLTVTEMIAAERNVSPDEIGYYRLRMPVKPLALGELAMIEPDARAVAAVVRE
ncbi:MAG TPA: (2Fe-2S)-binding protein, partial [Rhabdaerophilum sp.]|nr:(2Fe-2S)-binding protein [Rhabdaerophilum sp.]